MNFTLARMLAASAVQVNGLQSLFQLAT